MGRCLSQDRGAGGSHATPQAGTSHKAGMSRVAGTARWGGGEGVPQGDSDRTQMPDPFAAELIRLADEFGAGRVLSAVVPAWRRRTRGEKRWPVTLTVAVAVALQMQLSDSLSRPLPHYLLPGLEIALGVGLIIANPVRIERRGKVVRAGSIGLIMLISAANAISAILLIHAIIFSPASTSKPCLC